MPKFNKAIRFNSSQTPSDGGAGPKKLGALKQRKTATIDQYYLAKHCLICSEPTNSRESLAFS